MSAYSMITQTRKFIKTVLSVHMGPTLFFFSSFKPKGRTSRDTVPLTCAVCPALAISSITGIIPKLYYTEVVIYIMHVNSMGRTKQSWPML